MNKLWFGDNLKVLRKEFKDESVDLIYLDPPFNSKRDYNSLFKTNDKESDSQIMAFTDSWAWGDSTTEIYGELQELGYNYIETLVDLIGSRNSVSAYIVMMAIRLIELKRVLKDTGSIYLHCDPTASHYLKIVMDQIFGVKNFRNEIIWHYGKWTNHPSSFQKNHDVIFFYTKTEDYLFNQVSCPENMKESRRKKLERGYDVNIVENGIRQLIVYDKEKALDKIESENYDRIVYRENKYVSCPDVWQIPILNSQSKERLGYPTQKPLALLKRIIEASSNPGDVVLDPFCGCGTAVAAAHELNRKWVGIDIAENAVEVQSKRLKELYGLNEGKDFIVDTTHPATYEDALKLADRNKFKFEAVMVEMLGGISNNKKVGDRGIDGRMRIKINEEWINVLFQVKGGKSTQPKDVHALFGAMPKRGNNIGVLITRAKPSKNMYHEAALKGDVFGVPKMQILTLKEIYEGKKIKLPNN